MRPKSIGGWLVDAWRRLLREEEGIALLLALGIMLVLTISLTTIIFVTATNARDTQRTNAGQRAYALAEAGINNALSVLNANYPGSGTYPGNAALLPTRTTTYSTGTVTWSGSLVQATTSAGWPWQWNLTAMGDVSNPTGPNTADVKRTVTAVVPVVIPQSTSVSSSSSAINFIYAKNDITFGQSLNIEAPVYAGCNLTLANTATISENIPASATNPASKNRVAVGCNLTLQQNQNRIGEWIGDSSGLKTYDHESSAGQLAALYVAGQCSSKQNGNGGATYHSPCQEGDGKGVASTRDPLYAENQSSGSIASSIPPDFVTPPTMSCCQPVSFANPVVSNSPDPTSYLGFYYRAADLGPFAHCDPSLSSGAYPTFDNDAIMNESAYSTASPFNLTGTPYKCISRTDRGELSWDGTTLHIKGVIFIDGSACVGSSGCGTNRVAKYTGKGTIILTGSFSMVNGDTMCVGLSGSSCNQTVDWNPDDTSLGIIAYGDIGDGNGIEIKQGQIQGLMMANKNIYCQPASGTLVQGPMVSVYGSINCGQSSTLSFPAISYPSTGFAGSTGPLPLPVLLPPLQFGGG
jgi:Tfp pilus assembly protein PilX